MAKKFEELEIKDDFMFGVIMRDPKYCKPFLETIFGIKISHIEYPESQKMIDVVDETTKIILNTKGTMDDISPEMKRLLNFIDGQEPEDDFTKELAEAVESVRKNEKWRLDYMTLQMHYQEKYEEGLEQGLERGAEQEKVESAKRMLEDGNLSADKIALFSGLALEKVLEIEKTLQLV